jgi:glutamate synthase domain-containing protein 1
MLESMRHRGADSTGVTVAGERVEGDLILRVRCRALDGSRGVFEGLQGEVTRQGGSVRSRKEVGEYLRLVLDFKGEIRDLAQALLTIKDIEIHSLGRSSEVIKDVGDARALETRHRVSELRGTHGVGHVRMATESQVDITHSHPFWACPFSDITIVHNGQLTNYHKLKRLYQGRGYQFQTHNDSELIAIFLADRLSKGDSFQTVLWRAVEELDGTFTFLVSTANGLGFAKDRFSAKPLVFVERPDVVAIASEEVALRRVFPEEIDRFEPQEI